MAQQGLGSMPLHEAAREAGVQFHENTVPQSNFIEANGLKFHYLEWGDRTNQPIMMLHGMGQTAHSWDFAALALCDRFYVVALDQRGHGDSDWDADTNYSLDAYQSDLVSVLTALGLDNIVMMGLSMGGRNAFTYAADHPCQVSGLIVVDSAPTSSTHLRSLLLRPNDTIPAALTGRFVAAWRTILKSYRTVDGPGSTIGSSDLLTLDHGPHRT